MPGFLFLVRANMNALRRVPDVTPIFPRSIELEHGAYGILACHDGKLMRKLNFAEKRLRIALNIRR